MTLLIITSPKPVKTGRFINAYGQIGDVENRSMGLPLIGQNQIRTQYFHISLTA